MIESPPVLTIDRNFKRPDTSDIAKLKGVSTGQVVDALNGTGALDYRIKPLLPVAQSVVGVAVTCECAPGDNLGVLASLDVAQAGDIVVAAGGGYCGAAISGDLVSGMMKNRGILAFVTDAPMRDLVGIKEVGLPAWCAGITPNSPTKTGPAKVGLPIVAGGNAVCSGDILVCDLDGVVVIPAHLLPSVLGRVPRIIEMEKEREEAVQNGLDLPPIIETLRKQGAIEEL